MNFTPRSPIRSEEIARAGARNASTRLRISAFSFGESDAIASRFAFAHKYRGAKRPYSYNRASTRLWLRKKEAELASLT